MLFTLIWSDSSSCFAYFCLLAYRSRLATDSLCAAQIELNRVKGKPPYRELKGEGSVGQQADEAWEYARSRSNSVIQDVFAGQLQSTLQCPDCGALSHTFDEFMDLSLPLPQNSGLSLRGSHSCTIQVSLLMLLPSTVHRQSCYTVPILSLLLLCIHVKQLSRRSE